MELILNSDSLW